MGYHKNQIIAGQVEVGDRVPSPKPASAHISAQYPSRKMLRANRKQYRKLDNELMLIQVAMFALGGILVAAMWILTEVF